MSASAFSPSSACLRMIFSEIEVIFVIIPCIFRSRCLEINIYIICFWSTVGFVFGGFDHTPQVEPSRITASALYPFSAYA
jgi:hypothetical protein